MSVMTVETKITRQYLERKTKSDLAQMYLDLLDDNTQLAKKPCYCLGRTTIQKVATGDPFQTESVAFIASDELFHNDPYKALEDGLALVESAFAHVSHGGPTREDAEKWIAVARKALGKS